MSNSIRNLAICTMILNVAIIFNVWSIKENAKRIEKLEIKIEQIQK